jgi:DNA-binding CsgD family transcriptional regulator
MTHRAPTGDRDQKARMREAARRSEAVELLRLADSTVMYAMGQLSNGIGREAARQVGQQAAEELCVLAAALRRLTRLSARERAVEARRLAALGFGTQEIADRLGVSMHTAWHYRNGRRADGQPWAPG